MAGERLGRAYEAMVFEIVRHLVGSDETLRKFSVFWNETPNLVSVEPDVVVGLDVDQPSLVVLVTHTADKKKFEKKFWRNIGELAELANSYSPPPIILDVIFGDQAKKDLLSAMTVAATAAVRVAELTGHTSIDGAASRILTTNPTSPTAWAESIRQQRHHNLEFDRALAVLESRIETTVSELLRARSGAVHPSPASTKATRASKPTSVRNGLAQLALLDPRTREESIESVSMRRGIKTIPAYSEPLGIFTRAISGWHCNTEIRDTVFLLGKDVVRSTLSRIPESMTAIVQDVFSIGVFDVLAGAVAANYSKLTDLGEMAQALEEVRRTPGRFLGSELPIPTAELPFRVWLYPVVTAFAKARRGKIVSFGYANLAESQVGRAYQKGNMTLGEHLGCFFNRWVNRDDAYRIPEHGLDAVAEVLSGELLAIGSETGIRDLAPAARSMYTQEVLYRVKTYLYFDPLLWLIQGMLDRQDVTYKRIQRFPTCFAEAAGSASSATCDVLAVDPETLIMWQTAHGSHTNDKRKELCGRAMGLSHSWDPVENRFVSLLQPPMLLLVLDGTWRQEDLDVLSRSGWDEIFYPDEMDKLARAIV